MLTLDVNNRVGLINLTINDDNSTDSIEIPDCNEEDLQNLIEDLRDMALTLEGRFIDD